MKRKAVSGKYELVALDVDGTLIGPEGVVSAANVQAVGAIETAGIGVCLATGRSLQETMPVWRQLNLRAPFRPAVLIGGAQVCEVDGGRTLWQRAIPREAAWEIGDALKQMGHSAMAFVDPWRHGLSYYVAEDADIETVNRLWLEKTSAKMKRLRRLSDAADMPDPLRITAVTDPVEAPALEADLRERFGERVRLHAIYAPNYDVTIVEAFAPKADKFAGVTYIAQAHRIPPSRIVAVGDDVNDLEMLRGAGLGATFAGSTERVRTAADHVIETSLAGFLDDLLAGRFDGGA